MRADTVTQAKAETQLIARAKDGDEQAFEALFHNYERRVYLLCARMTRDTSEAEDLTQETFLQLFRRISTFRNESAFATWLHRIAINVVLMHFRRKRVHLVPFELPDESREGPAHREFGSEDRGLVGMLDHILIRRAIGQLPEGRRAALVLHDLEGYRHNEIAQLRNCSIGNSKSQLFRARINMRELLGSRREHPCVSETAIKKAKPRVRQVALAGKGGESICGFA